MDAQQIVGCPTCLVRRGTPCASAPMLRDIVPTHDSRLNVAAAIEHVIALGADPARTPEDRADSLADAIADVGGQLVSDVDRDDLVAQAERDGTPDLEPMLLTVEHVLLATRALFEAWGADQRALVENEGIEVADQTRDPDSPAWAAHQAQVAVTDDRVVRALQIAMHLGLPADLPDRVRSLWDVLEDAQVPS